LLLPFARLSIQEAAVESSVERHPGPITDVTTFDKLMHFV